MARSAAGAGSSANEQVNDSEAEASPIGLREVLIFVIVSLALLLSITGLGIGIGGPAANNAAIDLMPDAVARITGLRGMFRTTGGVLGTAVIVLLLAHYKDQAQGLEHIFRALAFLILLVIPPVFMIPDGARMRRGKGSSPGSGNPTPAVQGHLIE